MTVTRAESDPKGAASYAVSGFIKLFPVAYSPRRLWRVQSKTMHSGEWRYFSCSTEDPWRALGSSRILTCNRNICMRGSFITSRPFSSLLACTLSSQMMSGVFSLNIG